MVFAHTPPNTRYEPSPGRQCATNRTGVNSYWEHQALRIDDVESLLLSSRDPDEYDNRLHCYRCSRDSRSPKPCISCPRAKFLVFLPSLLQIHRTVNQRSCRDRLPSPAAIKSSQPLVHDKSYHTIQVNVTVVNADDQVLKIILQTCHERQVHL